MYRRMKKRSLVTKKMRKEIQNNSPIVTKPRNTRASTKNRETFEKSKSENNETTVDAVAFKNEVIRQITQTFLEEDLATCSVTGKASNFNTHLKLVKSSLNQNKIKALKYT